MSDPVARLNAALEGRYAIERELGEGGMATVYLADDVRHERKVALKVLKPELAAVVGAQRFLAEIKTTANLQHPHILPLFDSGEAEGFLFYVMPYVEGESLRDRLDRETQLPVEDALSIALRVADALEYAHEQGIVHRDIKPANILLSERGEPLVADFGIALALQEAGGGRLTETGLSLGTPHYMSPEQASGERSVDRRSDVYALACVLFEMLAGEPPFTAPTAQAVLARILTKEPTALTEMRKAVPEHVAGAVAKALEKLPADRFSGIHDFTEALKRHREVLLTTAARGGTGGTPRSQGAVPWLASAALAAALIWSLARTPAESAPEPRHWDIVLPDSAPMAFIGEAGGGIGLPALAISRDGEHLVYAARSGETTLLWIRSTSDGRARPLPGTEGAFAPFFSLDGEWIAFFVESELRRISIDGEQMILMAHVNFPYAGDWNEAGRIVVSVNDGTEFVVISASDGRIEKRVAVLSAMAPVWLPGNDWVLTTCQPTRGELCAVSVLSGETRLIRPWTAEGGLESDVLAGTNPRYLSSGHLIYSSVGENVLWGATFDPATLSLTGPPAALLRGFRREGWGAMQLTVSDHGDLVYARGSNAATGTFVWADTSGTVDSLTVFPTQVYGGFSISPDRRQVAVTVVKPTGRNELWFLDLERGTHRVWGGSLNAGGAGAWSADSRYLYQDFRDDRERILKIDALAASGGDTLYAGSEPLTVLHAMSDGSVLLWSLRLRFLSLLSEGDLRGFDGSLDALPRLMPSDGYHLFARFSPDQDWLAYGSTETGVFEVYAAPYPALTPPRQLSLSGGSELPLWAPDGSGLYYRDGQRFYWVERTESSTDPFATPKLFVRGNYRNVAGADLAVSADGKRLLLIEGPPDQETNTLHVVTSWFTELERVFGSSPPS